MKRILVGDDLVREQKSEPSPVVWLAAGIAEAFKSEIHLLHTYHSPELTLPPETMILIEGPFVEEMKRSLEEEAEAVRRQNPNLKIVATVERGNAVPLIVDDVKSGDCQFIVLGTHGRRGLKRMLLGSVAEEVMRKAPVPVLTVNPSVKIEPGFRPKKILLPVNLLLDPDPALELAVEFAKVFGASIVLIHVVEEWVYPLVQSASLLAGGVALPMERNLREISALRHSQLRDVAEGLGSRGLFVEARIVERANSVADGILKTADDEHCDLVVMSHRYASRFEYALEGSVSRRVAREAHCPVLSVIADPNAKAA